MTEHKITEVYTDWICDGCSWAQSKTVRFEKPVDWIRWSTIAEKNPLHRCPNGGHLRLNSIQWIE